MSACFSLPLTLSSPLDWGFCATIFIVLILNHFYNVIILRRSPLKFLFLSSLASLHFLVRFLG